MLAFRALPSGRDVELIVVLVEKVGYEKSSGLGSEGAVCSHLLLWSGWKDER